MPRSKTDPVTRARAELADIDAEIAGLEAQGREAERALADARRTMRSANLDEGLAAVRNSRESVVDLGEVLAAKRSQRDAKAAELAAAEADAAVDQLQALRAERSEAVQDVVTAARALRAGLDRLADARMAARAHLGGMCEGQYETAMVEADPARLAHWIAAGRRHFEFGHPAEGLDPDAWRERVDRPADDDAVTAGVDQFRESYRQRAEARLTAPDSGDAPASKPAA